MRKDNYAFFISAKNKPRDNGSKILLKRNELPQFQNLCIGHAQEFRRGLQYHLALPIEYELKENSSDTLKNIKLSIYSLHYEAKSLKLRTISIAKTSEINNILWEEILSTIKLAFSDSAIKIIICNGITQYATKEK